MVVIVSLIKHSQQRNCFCWADQEGKWVPESIMAELVTRKQISPGNIILVANFTLVSSSGHKIANCIMLIPTRKNPEASNLKSIIMSWNVIIVLDWSSEPDFARWQTDDAKRVERKGPSGGEGAAGWGSASKPHGVLLVTGRSAKCPFCWGKGQVCPA